jgi:hypothetical protein
MTKDLKKIINNRNDLLAEKERLTNSIKMRKAAIGNALENIRTEINPFSIFSKTDNDEGGFLSNKNNGHLINKGVSVAADFLLKKLLSKNTGFLPKLILPFVVKKISELLIHSKWNNKMITAMKNTADTHYTPIEKMQHDERIKTVHPSSKKRFSKKIAKGLHQLANRIKS